MQTSLTKEELAKFTGIQIDNLFPTMGGVEAT